MNWHSFKTVLGITLLSTGIQTAFSGTMGLDDENLDAWIFSIELGAQKASEFDPIFVNNGSIYYYPFNYDTYTTEGKNHGVAGFTMAYRWDCEDATVLPAYSLGLRYEHVFTSNMGNNILLYSLPAYNDYQYSWSLSSDLLLLASKIDLYDYNCFMPYINGGIGIALNHATSYRERPLASVANPRVSPAFASETKHQFAYTIGAGFDYLLNQNFVVSLGYEYQELGKFISGYGSSTNWRSQRLAPDDKYYGNTIIFSAGYIFDV